MNIKLRLHFRVECRHCFMESVIAMLQARDPEGTIDYSPLVADNVQVFGVVVVDACWNMTELFYDYGCHYLDATSSPVPEYCTQNGGHCDTCSLNNYGLDCRNNPIECSVF